MAGIVDLTGDGVVIFKEEQDLAILLEWRQSRQSGIGRQQLEVTRPRVAVVGHFRHRFREIRVPVQSFGSHCIVGAPGHRPDPELLHSVTSRRSDQFRQFLVGGRLPDPQVYRYALLRVVEIEPLVSYQPKSTNQHHFNSTTSSCNFNSTIKTEFKHYK